MAIGNVALVLNAHFPYVRRAGRWPHGEESLHKVIAESYIPLLMMLSDVRSAAPKGIPITLAPSPILLEQLADPVIAKHFTVWLAEWRDRAVADLARFEAHGDGHSVYLARFYLDWIDAVERAFTERFNRHLGNALRGLLRETTELLLSPATFAYLPHLHAAEVRAQLDSAALVVLRHLGRRPAGLWLPGGGAPPDLLPIASELGLTFAVGEPIVQAVVSCQAAMLPTIHADGSLLEHIVAPVMGYPGDGLYREFHRDHPDSGIAYWRVTGAAVPLHAKAPYDPYLAFSRADEHAEHFVRVLRSRLRAIDDHRHVPTVVLTFDAELFGHWWFEGVRWLERVLRLLLADDDLKLVTLSAAMSQLPQHAPAGESRYHPIFDAPLVAPLRERAASAAHRLMAMALQHPTAEDRVEAVLCQAARELLLARSSDWLTLIATGAARDYAQRRFDEHVDRLERLLHYVEHDDISSDAERYLHEISELDNPFPFLNYRMFC